MLIPLRNREPIVDLITFGLYKSTVPSVNNTAVAPAEALVLMIVPRFPGSCKPFKTTTKGFTLRIISANDISICSATAIIP
ncbi:hypothetical protein ES705_31277 [subsurface metagenome]